MKKAEKKLRHTLLKRALELTRFGISVIPVHGDSAPKEPKKPTIRWRTYQKRIMRESELKGAFAGDARALGIICGRVSGLVVVDFDDHLRYRRFCRHRPDLAESYTVKTRRGYHVYFRTSEKVPSHQFDGGDIKGERSYVVAPPSVIAGFQYRRVNRQDPIKLDRSGIDALLNHFHVNAAVNLLPGKRVREGDDIDLGAMYQRLAPRIGRNNALYRTASAARDSGISKSDAERQLSVLHVQEREPSGHRPESRVERMREAERSVSSAYHASGNERRHGEAVPNSVREKLLQEQRSSVVARLLDIMMLEGWQPESYFTMVEAIKLGCRYRLNRKSVMQSLTGELSTFNGRHIIARRYVEYLDIRGLKSRKRGRPVDLLFQVPSPGRLLWVLNVDLTPSDRVTAEDLKSSHAYRRALHREYIRRLSPQLPMKFMAERVGVSPRTVRRYNRTLGVKATVCVGRFALTWDRLGCLPRRRSGARGITAGYWLESDDGYRAPAWRHIGSTLLRRGEPGLQVCAQRTCVWSLSPEPVRPIRYGKMSPKEFLQLRLLRDGLEPGASALEPVRRVLEQAKSLAAKVRYEKMRLFYDSVSARIADDKVAETIGGYLWALDERGVEVRRPARRGVAYRMLKEFGNGNVFLALRDSYRDLLVTLASHAARGGKTATSLELVAPLFA